MTGKVVHFQVDLLTTDLIPAVRAMSLPLIKRHKELMCQMENSLVQTQVVCSDLEYESQFRIFNQYGKYVSKNNKTVIVLMKISLFSV